MSLLLVAVLVYAAIDPSAEHPHPAVEPMTDSRGPDGSATAPLVRAEPDRVSVAVPEEPFVHVVEPGDRLTLIASKYNVTIEAIVEANPGLDPDVLRVGMRVHVPGATTQPATRDVKLGPTPGEPTAEHNEGVIAHVVERGELLAALAETYGVPVDHIIAFNRLDGDHITEGQRLMIPPPSLPVDH